VARNRKRRSAGRARSPQAGAARPGVATAADDRVEDAPSSHQVEDALNSHRVEDASNPERVEDPPNPLDHGTPDVELAEEQLLRGRPELTDAEIAENERDAEEGGYDEGGDDSEVESRGSRARHSASTSMAVRPRNPGARLVEFLRGSWRELQRVQWPDRRQVMQATGVVIGFVIVAGVYLGVADLVASKLVKLILP
jgi:preprotein translocase subunit SecE